MQNSKETSGKPMCFMKIKYFIFSIGRINLYKSGVQQICWEVVKTKDSIKGMEKGIDETMEEIKKPSRT